MAKTKGKKPGPKKKKSKELTPDQKHKAEKRAFAKSIQLVFDRIGFKRCSALSDIEIEFDGRKGDFDDAFRSRERPRVRGVHRLEPVASGRSHQG